MSKKARNKLKEELSFCIQQLKKWWLAQRFDLLRADHVPNGLDTKGLQRKLKRQYQI